MNNIIESYEIHTERHRPRGLVTHTIIEGVDAYRWFYMPNERAAWDTICDAMTECRHNLATGRAKRP